jgi:ABC-2 type transport system ATP-binding protein
MRTNGRRYLYPAEKDQSLMDAGAAIEASGLIKIYKGADTPAVNQLSLRIEKGSIFGLLGPNGAGKTTTISMLCGLVQPSSGKITVEGLDLSRQKEAIKKLIGVVPQDIALYPALTAYENLHYIGNMYGLKGHVLRNGIMSGLETFGLAEKASRRIETFSGGMKRRINLLAGVLHSPSILFLDEPTVGVDVQSRAVIVEHLRNLNSKGMTIVYTSHLMDEAEQLCTEISIVDEGRQLAAGTPASLRKEQDCSSLEEVFLKLTGRKLRD